MVFKKSLFFENSKKSDFSKTDNSNIETNMPEIVTDLRRDIKNLKAE